MTNEERWSIFIEELKVYIQEHHMCPPKHTTLGNKILCWTPHKTLFVSIALIVGGFFVPPLGIIDGSVLTAVGELLMFGVLVQVPVILDAARKGKSIKVSKGDFSVDVTGETNNTSMNSAQAE